AGSFIFSFLKTPQATAANALFASAVASIKVEQSGPDFKVPKDEITKRVKSLEKELKIIK
ncbi:MAG: hypothetical protein ACXACA_08210, partial [Candidatus Ranarchaeia archaeon]